MFSLEDFKDFLGLGQDEVEGQKAVGIVVVTKTAQPNQPLNLPSGTRFDEGNSGLKFFTTETQEISESALFLPVAVQAQKPGILYNIPANGLWASPQIGGVTITNPNAFSNGTDTIPEKPGIYPLAPGNISYPENQMRFCLDLSEQLIKDQIGWKQGEDFDFEDKRIVQASNLLTMYALQNNSIQELSYSTPTTQDVSPQQVKYFRHQVFMPLQKHVSRILTHKNNFKRLINPEPQSA